MINRRAIKSYKRKTNTRRLLSFYRSSALVVDTHSICIYFFVSVIVLRHFNTFLGMVSQPCPGYLRLSNAGYTVSNIPHAHYSVTDRPVFLESDSEEGSK